MFVSDLIYVQVFENLINWENFSEGTESRLEAQFSCKKLKLSDFDLAEEVLRSSLTYTGFEKFSKAHPVIIMHQPGDEGKLSQLELRALRELGYGAGAKMVYVWEGQVLDENDIKMKFIKAHNKKGYFALRAGCGGALRARLYLLR